MTIYRTKYAPVEVNGEIAKDPNDYERHGIAPPTPVTFDDLEDSLEEPEIENPPAVEEDVSPVVGALLQNPTEDNVALAFAQRHEGEYAFLHGVGKWFRWDGTRWQEDVIRRVTNDIRNMARAHNIDGKATPAKNSFVTGVDNLCRTDPVFARDAKDFDRDNYLLNCPDGTYDLRTMTRRDHDPEDSITKLAGASPDNSGGEVFRRFMSEITEGDDELVEFFQRSLGACLSGAVEEHWLLFWNGIGRNGKNTLGDTILGVMGDYARTVPSSTLMAQKHTAHPTEIMNLKGMRLVTSGEVEEGAHWAEAKIKELTGDEYLNGHFMRQDWMTFRRTHKHLIYGNHRPQLRNVDVGIRSRLKIVPFKACFRGREDADLPRKLKAESGYILWWLMEGHTKWLEAGKTIGTCNAVEEETRDYYDSQSTIDAWLEDCCMTEQADGQPGRHWAKAGDLYKSYQDWKHDRGENAQSQTRFGEQLSKKFTKIKAAGNRYEGLKLKSKYGEN